MRKTQSYRTALILTSLTAVLVTTSCDQCKCSESSAPATTAEAPESAPNPEVAAPVEELDPTAVVVRINSTQQSWSAGQPWEKTPSRRRRSLGAVVADNKVITTAEMVADATYLELETSDGVKLAPAEVVKVDYEANLALLKLEDPEGDAEFFEGLTALEIATDGKPGDSLEIIQVESNGTPLVTPGVIQGLDVVSSFLPGQYFLSYEVKASMQDSASSFSLPVLRDDKLAGLLTSYSAKNQLSDVTATEIIRLFLEDKENGDYKGFPSLGVASTSTDDTHFRSWLKLPAESGGIYITFVRKDSAAEKAGIKEGDVVINVDGHDIDRQGFYDDENYGRIFWSHLVRGAKKAGDSVDIKIIRDGEPLEITAVLERRDSDSELIPSYIFGKGPNYLIKGGLIFQELTRPLLEAFGDEWQSRAPLNLLNVYENSEEYEDDYDRVVFLAGVIATPATVGYEPMRNLVVTEINGQKIRDMKSAVDAFNKVPEDGLNVIRFEDEEIPIYLDELMAAQVDGALLQRGINKLARTGEQTKD